MENLEHLYEEIKLIKDKPLFEEAISIGNHKSKKPHNILNIRSQHQNPHLDYHHLPDYFHLL